MKFKQPECNPLPIDWIPPFQFGRLLPVISFIGNLRINNVSNGSNVQVGDAFFITLTSNNKFYTGANSYIPGDSFGTFTNNAGSMTDTSDPDLFDGTNII